MTSENEAGFMVHFTLCCHADGDQHLSPGFAAIFGVAPAKKQCDEQPGSSANDNEQAKMQQVKTTIIHRLTQIAPSQGRISRAPELHVALRYFTPTFQSPSVSC
ncbi:MAG: hypothetical protein JKY10_07445 [Cohaesibacteraceae bacterium]|nr:hypothetical protein [Cohaesibacteraceae bacterium]